MIKLFWNTHNQKKPSSTIKEIKNKEELDFSWGKYHKKNSDKWIFEILNKIQYTVIDTERALEKGDTLIIIDSSVEEKIELYEKFKSICYKVFLFHLGDETGSYNISSVYDCCNYIWRPFCSSRYFVNKKVKCIPIGYKSGVKNISKENRKYKWAFTGTPHKSSRQDLLYQFSDIKPYFCHKTQKFDVKTISVNEMNEVLSLTEFIPCPNGFFHPETYRLYEALESGCIPIVESAYNYYDRIFPNNPFIKINKWIEAKEILNNWNKEKINLKSKECKLWWESYKKKIQDSIKEVAS